LARRLPTHSVECSIFEALSGAIFKIGANASVNLNSGLQSRECRRCYGRTAGGSAHATNRRSYDLSN
jgi:hypothetical protein